MSRFLHRIRWRIFSSASGYAAFSACPWRACGKQIHFRLLEFYDIDEAGKELTYEQVGQRFELKTSDVTNYLAYARREFRRIVLEQLREMTGSEDEFRREARTLLGIDTP